MLETDPADRETSRVVNLAARFIRRNMLERHILLLILDVEQHGVPLVKRAATAVLAAEADRRALFHQCPKSQGFRHAVIYGTFANPHFGTLFQQLFHLGMYMKIRGVGAQLL